MKKEFYVNGNEFGGKEHFITAEGLLKRTRDYNVNFGPYLEEKVNSSIKEIRRFIIQGFEYVEVSIPTIGNNDLRMIWFQTI